MSGFSFFEILIALVIAGVIAFVSIGGLQSSSSQAKSQMIESKLVQALQFAEQKAMTARFPVAFCLARHNVCSQDAADNMLVFRDAWYDGVIHEQSQILKRWQISIGQGRIYQRLYPKYRNYLLFSSSPADENDNGTLWLCQHHRQTVDWAVMISKVGRIRIQKPDQSGQVNDAEGKALTCYQQ